MTQVTLYGLSNCDTCRKAIAALRAGDHTVTFVDIRSEADLDRLLPSWIGAVGVETLLNRRSTSWRALDDGVKSDPANFTEAGAARLLAQHPTLIKRPVIEAKGKIMAGWSKTVEAAI